MRLALGARRASVNVINSGLVHRCKVSRQASTPERLLLALDNAAISATHLVRFSTPSGILFSVRSEACWKRRVAVLSKSTPVLSRSLSLTMAVAATKRNPAFATHFIDPSRVLGLDCFDDSSFSAAAVTREMTKLDNDSA